ncbi:MAG: iron ABC transporter substrate-binding protein [Methanoregula sp.]|jgi:iron complex transport system substrate-binding protein
MNMKKTGLTLTLVVTIFAVLVLVAGCINNTNTPQDPGSSVSAPTGEPVSISITDGYGRIVSIPTNPDRIICSGSGCLRYVCYLGAQNKIVGVDSIEKTKQAVEGRAYALANPQFASLPLIGEYRGKDDPEKIIGIGPQVIFKTASLTEQPANAIAAADTLQNKTAIPVVEMPYGDLSTDNGKTQAYSTLRMMGTITHTSARAEELIAYIDATVADLKKRTQDIPKSEQKTAYVGGVSYSGPHGIISTEPAYPPFAMVNVNNIAGQAGTQHADISKETLVSADPDFIFIDLGTTQIPEGGAIVELRTNPAFSSLLAVKNQKVYGILPYNFYSTNYESVLADAYFIGKTMYPDRFADIDPQVKADEIYTEFVGKPVFASLNANYDNSGFQQIPV